MRFTLFFFALLYLCAARARAAGTETTELCRTRILAGEKISFTSTESKWLCGDPDSDAWKEIPVSQRKEWLKTFLQSRGYNRPAFREEPPGSGNLVVDAGPKARVKKFSVAGGPPDWDWTRRRHVLGAVLNPSRLDDDVSWAKRQLEYRGYPCPKVTAHAYLDDGEIHLDVVPGNKQRFGPVGSQGTSDMDPRILERFTAFYPDDFFDIRLLELTSDRILKEDLYLSTFYDVMCPAEERERVRAGGASDDQQHATIVRRFVPAAPRLLTVGAGFDTENGPLLRGRWKRSRLTRKGDSFETSAFLSFRDLQVEMKYRNHFPKDLTSRFEFAPRILVDRRDERQLKSLEYLAEPAFATSWELRGSQVNVRFGPALSRTDTLFSLQPVPSRVDVVRAVASAEWTSHFFEYYADDPREGYHLTAEAFTQFGRWLSDKTVHKLLVKQEVLFNLGGFDPPFLVLGWRGFEGTFFFNPHDFLLKEIPPGERFFLGGDEDIRGFGRQKLQGTGIGYLTAVYQGLELRAVDILPANLQPFLFLDAARAGLTTETVDSPLYWSPGVGMRWKSPVGTLRTTLARGFATEQLAQDPVPNLQFFVSFGREF